MISRIKHNDSVFLRLLAVLVLLAVIPSAVISYIIYSMDRSRHLDQTAILLNSLAADRELATRLLIEKQVDALDFLAKDTNTIELARKLRGGNGPSDTGPLERMVSRSPFFAGLWVVDNSTGAYRGAGAFPEDLMRSSALEMKKKQAGPFVRMMVLPDGERALLIGQPVLGEGEPGSGIVMLGLVKFTLLNNLYKDTSMLGATGESFLADSKGVALTALRYSTHGKSHDDPIGAKAMLDCLAGNSQTFVITPDYVDVPTAMSYRPVQGYGGCVMVHMRASEVMAPINALRNMTIAIVATVLATVALMAFFVISKLLRMDKERKYLEEELAGHAGRLESAVEERTAELKREIESRTEAELRLHENKLFLESIVHNVHEVIFLVGVEGPGVFRFIWANANGERMIGGSAADRTPQEVFGPETGDRLSKRFAECVRSGVVDYEEGFEAHGGARALLTTLVPVRDETGKVARVISSAIDITERKKLEGEMIKTQKLESLGVLAGGLAHDFNNLLAAMRLNISMLKRSPGLDPEELEMVKLLDTSTSLAANLTNQLLTFAKGSKPTIKAVPVTEFLADVANFSLRGTKTACKLELPDGLLDIEADRGQITQVINNILINAEQAMPEGGTVTVSAENVELAGTEKSLPLKPGRYVKIAVEDHGMGIPEENLPRIFDPYFTTKQTGSGLGLASSYSIIKNHNGHISVRSESGRGSVFEVFVPATARSGSTKAGEEEFAGKGSGRVLVMDDDELVRTLVCKALGSLGYEAEEAPNGQEAVRRYREARENGKPFSAVILDLTVPSGMGGEEAVKKILELDGSARVFASSGYSNSPVISDYAAHGFCGFLKKPYDISELGLKLREALAEKNKQYDRGPAA